MGYIQLIIILLFVGIALINALYRINRSRDKKGKSENKSKEFLDQQVHYPSIEDEDSYVVPAGTAEVSNFDKIDVEKVHQERRKIRQEIKKSVDKDQSHVEAMSEPLGSKSIQPSKNIMTIGALEKSDYQETKKVINRIKRLPFFKQAIVMSEILGKPKGL